MYWVDRIAKEIIESEKFKPYWVDDMKTPSGRIHVGSLRGVLIHDFVYKSLLYVGQQARFTYLFEDHDPMDELPHYLDKKDWEKYLGQPLFTVPSPDGDIDKNYARYFALEFQDVFNAAGAKPEIIWVSDLYKTGKMNNGVKICLDNANIIRQIYEEIYKKKLSDNWYPFKVVCPECGKESTTNVTNWDGEQVEFTCEVDIVKWTKGCGYSGKMSPFSGGGKFVGKLPWKVEWPVKWQTIGVTIEGAGKDHMSAGGSHDIARFICERVLHYPIPYAVGYEFFLLAGRKMSSSKGLGVSAKEISETMPPYLTRFLFARTDYHQAINFDPVGTMVIPDLFDEYDRCWQAYNTGSNEDLARVFEMSQIDEVPVKNPKLFIPRFRDVVTYIQQPNISIEQKFTEIKGESLTDQEAILLEERISYARVWIERYAPEEFRLHMKPDLPVEVEQLDGEQKNYLESIVQLIESDLSADQLQTALYESTKKLGIDTKRAFAAIYLAFIGKTHGPKAGWFLCQYPKETVVNRLKEASKS